MAIASYPDDDDNDNSSILHTSVVYSAVLSVMEGQMNQRTNGQTNEGDSRSRVFSNYATSL